MSHKRSKTPSPGCKTRSMTRAENGQATPFAEARVLQAAASRIPTNAQFLLTPPPTIRQRSTTRNRLRLRDLPSRAPSSDSIPSMSEFLELTGLLSSPTNSQIPVAGGAVPAPTFAPATTQDDHQKLQLVKEAFKSAAECPICRGIMENPFVLRCLHSFCGMCIRKTFQDQVRPHLHPTAGVLLSHSKHKYDCHTVPTSLEHLRETVRAIRRHGQRKPEDIFKYQCPFCRGQICEEPTLNPYKARTFLSDIKAVLRLNFTGDEMAHEDGVHKDGFFDGLFLLRDM